MKASRRLWRKYDKDNFCRKNGRTYELPPQAEGKRKIFVEETNLDCCNLSYLHIDNYTVTKGVHCTYDEDDYSEIQIDGYWIEW